MVKDLIRYDLLVQDALKSVVRKVLTDASRHGLPGEHHFYVTFLTGHPGVRISNRLREKYPQEMTIVVQHQFWDLNVGETAFEIGLSFSNIPERLHVSFDALTGFFDPSVQFGLKFNVPEDDVPAAEPVPLETELSRKAREKKERATSRPEQETIHAAEEDASKKKKEAETTESKSRKPKADTGDGAEVVSLDAFRKK